MHCEPRNRSDAHAGRIGSSSRARTGLLIYDATHRKDRVEPMCRTIDDLQAAQRAFAQERDWGQFHTPKNLASALAVEAAELLEHFQWLTEEQSRTLPDDKRVQVGEEIADVPLYLLQLSDKLQIDVMEAAWRKIGLNAEKYPVDRSKGSIRKYSDI